MEFEGPRPLEASEIRAAAQLWYDGWYEAHLDIVPASLTALRTLDSFHDRLAGARAQVSVMGPVGAPVALCQVNRDELKQLFVAPEARAHGVAAKMIADAESRLDRGLVWLACSVGNDRAARFYEKHGWRNRGVVEIQVDTSEGPYDLGVWRFDKLL